MAEARGVQLARKPKGARWSGRLADRLAPYLFISPFLVAFVGLFLGPALYALVVSFFKYKGYGTLEWVGLSNYSVTLQYGVFWQEMLNVAFYWVAHTIPMMAIAFLLAVVVSSSLVKHKKVFKPVIYMPQLVAGVASALLFKNFFGTNYGILNTMLGVPIPWLEDMNLARWAVVIMLVWRSVGYWFVIYLAGLTSISEEVMDAATVDGVSAWQRLTRITVPLMRNSFLFSFVIDAVVTLRMYAEPNILGGKAGAVCPVGMAPVLNTLVLNMQAGRFGQAAAVGWLIFLFVAVVSFVQYRVLGGRRREG